jgi:hypothetical protein
LRELKKLSKELFERTKKTFQGPFWESPKKKLSKGPLEPRGPGYQPENNGFLANPRAMGPLWNSPLWEI